MREQSTETVTASRPVWEGLEDFARQGVQDLLQRVLEEEVAAMLGRRRYARREGVDAPAGYRNGYGKPRRLSLSVGTISLRRPRVRGLDERFESQLLPLFKRRTEAVWASCSRSCTCTVWHWATSTWPRAACSATAHHCRRPRSPD